MIPNDSKLGYSVNRSGNAAKVTPTSNEKTAMPGQEEDAVRGSLTMNIP